MKFFCKCIPILALTAVPLAVQPSLYAEDSVIVVSSAGDLSEGLDLNALGEVFKSSDDLQHFERQLNNPELYLNNLDLNEDGIVDFLRVLEEETEIGRMIVIQAIVGDNEFTDVAYIDVQRDQSGRYKVQIRGEEALYGEHTYYVPRYDYVSWPIVFSLWGPDYYYYTSPYSWGYYPSWYTSYSCVRVGFYRARVSYRYPRNYFTFSYHACFDNYVPRHHRSHRYYRDYDWRRNDRHNDDRHPGHNDGRRDYGRDRSYRTKSVDDHDRSNNNYRRKDGEDRNKDDEKFDQMRRLARDNKAKGDDRTRVHQDRMDRNPSNTSARIMPRRSSENTGNAKRDIQPDRSSNRTRAPETSKPTTRTSESYHPSKPSPSPSPTSSRSEYKAPKPSSPSRTYTAPTPSKPSNTYTAPRPQPRSERNFTPSSSSGTRESPRSSNARSRENNNRGDSSRPGR